MRHPLPMRRTPSREADSVQSCSCRLNSMALEHLQADAPDKRRKVYLEFEGISATRALKTLAAAGFDVETCRHMADEDNPGCHCVITGTSQTILAFVTRQKHLRLASVDLPEYSWLSAI